MFENKKIHLIGIGGVSMSGIAQILKDHKAIVTGSDIHESDYTKMLINDGINVLYGHHPELVENADIVVYTAAIHEDDPERVKAKELGIETHERAEFLGILSKEYKNCLCISGTHGKSTTTSMVSLIFLAANLNPTIQIGAILPQINGNTKIGSKDYLIMEACEYVDSFLHFHPTSEIVLNIDNDHLDYFHNLDNIKTSFKKYSELLPQNGLLVLNNDDKNSQELHNTNVKIITYGIDNDADYTAQDITYNKNGMPSFNIIYQDKVLTRINLSVHGYHNIYNALAAFALSNYYIEDINIIKKGIEDYRGAKRRFEFIGTYKDTINVYDDYAHHPTEVATTLKTVEKIPCNESWAIFQSHTYSRTAEHYKTFAKILANFDHVVIATIYPAREVNTFGITEDMIINEIKKENKNVVYINDFDKITEYLKKNLKPNDLVVTIGAGPINEVGLKLLEKEKNL
jgi:UDP-N-acetylmuramate--alanine ligase